MDIPRHTFKGLADLLVKAGHRHQRGVDADDHDKVQAVVGEKSPDCGRVENMSQNENRGKQ